ncbi:hypothetical protein AAHE18_04G115000 [Arachis hypogaea]|nr:beta-galactosidase isoform X1 [Arachis hypogaea]XP_025695138.1 beta-galactosidase isoform X1 [Arachis hypogaea]XP_029153684.1 beta-galactosidase isoform X1 [Arachis hypogaea]
MLSSITEFSSAAADSIHSDEDQFDVIPPETGSVSSLGKKSIREEPSKRKNPGAVKISPWTLARLNAEELKIEEIVTEMGGLLHAKASLDLNFVIVKNVLATKYKIFLVSKTFSGWWTNFDRTAGGPYIATSYDYDAPLDEYGNKAQPKWGHLKELHRVLKSMEESLTNGNVFQIDFGNSVTATVYASNKSSSCFLTNANTTTDATVSFRGRTYAVPAWSV